MNLNFSSQMPKKCNCDNCKKSSVCKFVGLANDFKIGIKDIKSKSEVAFNPLRIELNCEEFERKQVVDKNDTFYR